MSELFLIHGWNMPNSIWTELQSHWQHTTGARVNITAAILPGYASENPNESIDLCQISETAPSIESRLSEHLDSLLEQAPPSAHWCGWSLGATLALAAAIRFKNRIRRLTLISPTPRFLESKDWQWGMKAVHFDKLKRVTDRNFDKGWERFFQLQLPRDMDTKRSQTLMKQIRSGFDRPSNIALEHGKRILCELDLRDDLKQIDIPTQVIASEHDQIVPTEASRFVHQQIPHANFHLLNEGHGIPYLFPVELARLVANWEAA